MTTEGTEPETTEEEVTEDESVEESSVEGEGDSQGGGNAGVSDDLKVLNAELGYPIGEAVVPQTDAGGDLIEEPADGEPEVGEDGAESDVPTEENTVAEIKAYLDAQGTEYSSSATKAELLELV